MNLVLGGGEGLTEGKEGQGKKDDGPSKAKAKRENTSEWAVESL